MGRNKIFRFTRKFKFLYATTRNLNEIHIHEHVGVFFFGEQACAPGITHAILRGSYPRRNLRL